MAPPTIQQCFRQGLPSLPESPVQHNYRSITASSQSTEDMNAPTAFAEENPNDIVDLALARLPPNVLAHNNLQQYMPQLERSHLLRTETDVLRASILHLLHPVNIAASTLVPTGQLFCQTEQYSTHQSRTDITWVYQHPQTQQLTNVAVLELKNTKVLKWADFSPARAGHQHPTTVMAKAMGNPPYYTNFKGNALWVSKQARKYCIAVGTPDVAIFDWNAMFIFDFSYMRENLQVPEFARGYFFAESPQNVGGGYTFRLFLLGFLIRALRRRGFIS